MKMENCICLHEQDGGIGWKHTNYRTNVAAVVRSRVLVLQTIITVANYEYIFVYFYHFISNLRLGNLAKRQTSILKSVPLESFQLNLSTNQ